MKKWILALATLATVNTAFALEYNIDIDLKIKSDDLLKLNRDSGKFTKVYSLISTNTHVVVKAEDQVVVDATEPKSERDDSPGEFSLRIIDSNTVKITDHSLINGKDVNIDSVVKAKIERSIMGNVKSIKISKEDLLGLYSDVYRNVGLNMLASMNVKVEDAEISSRVDLSGMNCTVEKESMNCVSGVDIHIHIKTED